MIYPAKNRSQATLAQVDAARPDSSVWVSANAGSGKTRVLVNRVARLLLAGAAPERILCLTYTKAAAAEMQNRLLGALGGWAMADDAVLERDLAQILAEDEAPLPRSTLDAARRLFAQTLETPGGLKVQTIHAFCERLLRRFAPELGLAPGFEIMDEAQAAQLRATARDTVIAAREGSSQLAQDFERLLEDLGEATFDDMLADIVHNRARFAGASDAPEAALAKALGARPGACVDDLLEEWRAGLDLGAISDLAEACARSTGKTDKETHAPGFKKATLGRTAQEVYAALTGVLLTQKGAPKTRGLPSKWLEDNHSASLELIPKLQNDLMDLRGLLNAAVRLEASAALARFAKAVLAEYQVLKSAAGALDFDDLITHACALLTDASAKDWVRFKLDGGVAHLLVDEAQDTSPAQWTAIAALAEDFFDANRPQGAVNTIFAVGDEKQSIYSFQGAQPRLLGEMGQKNRAAAEAAGLRFSEAGMATSFRSAPEILRFVDKVFAPEHARAGMFFGDKPVLHQAFRASDAGRVELWPLVEAVPPAEAPAWHEPVDAPPPDDPVRRLAGLVAQTIVGWIGREPLRDRVTRAGDVLVLVRKRSALSSGIIKKLKQLGAPVAGRDRLRLGDELAVQDLLALARFALTPEDDLTLAALLRSPFCDVDEEALFHLAHPRAKGRMLWDELCERRDERPAYAQAHALLAELIGLAPHLRPFEFFARILGPMSGRTRLLARLGGEAEDVIDEFLGQTLAFEASETPSLRSFLAWLDARDLDIKREFEQGADEIRVMTAHGSKGLEAPVVVIPDTVGAPTGARPPSLLISERQDCPPIWAGRKDDDPPALRALREAHQEREAEEHRRLLYVALTRAEDRLVICGASKRKPPEGCWYQLCADAMAADSAPFASPVLSESGKALEGASLGPAPQPSGAPAQAAAEVRHDPPAPKWLRAQLAPEAALEKLSPSGLGGYDPEAQGEQPSDSVSDFQPYRAKRRGVLIHALLERLAQYPPEARPGAAQKFLMARGRAFSASQRAGMAQEALAVLAHRDLAWVFGEDSVAEVSLLARPVVLKNAELTGVVDRLILNEGGVSIVDFKTGAIPETPPEGYLRQLGAYAAAAELAFPGRTIQTFLLWTSAPRIDEIAAQAREEALFRAQQERA